MAVQYIDPVAYSSGASASAPILAVVPRDLFKEGLLDDLDNVFHDSTEYAFVITYTYAVGGTDSINGIFDEEHMEQDVETGAPVIAREPTFHCPSRQFTKDPGKDDSAIIQNRQFHVVSVEPDGTGLTVVTLRDN